jgi:hypothetical protein
MSEDAVPSGRAATEHSIAVPGGTIYYRTEGYGPPLVLIGGGPSNADTLGALAGHLATGAGTYNIGPSINVSSPTSMRISGAGSNVSKTNITLSSPWLMTGDPTPGHGAALGPGQRVRSYASRLARDSGGDGGPPMMPPWSGRRRRRELRAHDVAVARRATGCACAHRSCTAPSDGGDLRCCGGHSRPPLCPSGGNLRSGSKKSWALGAH